MKLNSSEFYQLSPIELYEAIKDNTQEEEKHMRNTWEVMRVQLFHIYNQNPYVKKKPKKATQVIEFAWDKERKITPKQQSLEEMKNILQAIHVANVLSRDKSKH